MARVCLPIGTLRTSIVDPSSQSAVCALDLAAPLVTVLAEAHLNKRTTYLYGLGDSPLAGDDGAAWTYLSGRDALNSVRQETDAAGQVLSARSFDPYGVVLSGDGGTPFGWTGEFRDAASGLVFLRARYLQVAEGRFITRDIWPGDETSPITFNAWAYSNGNPVTFKDSTGHWPEWPDDAYNFVSGASGQYLDDLTFGWFSQNVLHTDLSVIDNECYQSGREAGRAVSTAQAAAEMAAGGGVAGAGAAGLAPTITIGAGCVAFTGGFCAAGVVPAVVVEGGMIVVGGATLGHGTVMMARNRNSGDEIQRSKDKHALDGADPNKARQQERAAAREAARRLGIKDGFTPKQMREIHDLVSGQHWDYQEIVNNIMQYFGGESNGH